MQSQYLIAVSQCCSRSLKWNDSVPREELDAKSNLTGRPEGEDAGTGKRPGRLFSEDSLPATPEWVLTAWQQGWFSGALFSTDLIAISSNDSPFL